MEKLTCNDHGKQVLYICDEHEVPICGDCLIKVHFVCVSKQSVISIDDRMVELRNECKQLIDEARKHKELAGSLIEEKKRRKENVNDKCKEFTLMIETTRKQLNEILDKKEEEILKEIKEIELEQKLSYNDSLTKMTDVQGKLSSLITELEKAQNVSYVQLTSDLIRGKGCVKDISDIIRNCSISVLTCDFQYHDNREDIEVLKGLQTFGKISKSSVTDRSQSECSLQSSNSPNNSSSALREVENASDICDDEMSIFSEETGRGQSNESDTFASVSRHQRGNCNTRELIDIDRGSVLQEQSYNDNESSTLTQNNSTRRLQIKRDTRSVIRQNRKGESKKYQMEYFCTLKLPDPFSETDIVVLPNGRVVVSVVTTGSLQVLEKDGTFAFCSTEFKNPQGIVHIDGNRIALATADGVFILVVQTSKIVQLQKLCDGEFFGIYYRNRILAMCANNYVLIISVDGKVINRIERFGLVVKYQLQKPRYVAIDLTGRFVYISDEETRKVVCSTIKGVKKWEVQLQKGIPKGIESSENIYVAVPEMNNITELSPSGEFLASFCLELSPYGLHIDAEGALSMTNHQKMDDKFEVRVTILHLFDRGISNV